VKKNVIRGNPDPENISTSYVERFNLSSRMQMRRCTRLTNGFSKKLENHEAAVSLWVCFYNFCCVHETLRCTPAMELGVTDHIWTIGELVAGSAQRRRSLKARTAQTDQHASVRLPADQATGDSGWKTSEAAIGMLTLKGVATYVLILRNPTDRDKALARLGACFKDFKEIAPNAWIIKASLGSENISRTLFPRDESGKPDVLHITFLTSSWWGYHNKQIWEWLSLPAKEADG
jgi:hypothetical protein